MKFIRFAFLASAALLAHSCKKFIQVDKPIDRLEETLVFSSNQSALSAVSAMYYYMHNISTNIANGGATTYTGLAADEIYNTTPNEDYDEFLNNAISPNNSTGNYGRLWAPAYQNIYRANAVLEGLGAATSITDSVKRQLTGEVKLLRSFYYFYLINLFGDVPLVLSTDQVVNAVMPRTPVTTVYQQIVTDLNESKALLSNSYPSAGKVRPNRYTASAFLARVYLFTKEWSKAEEEATNVISGPYLMSSMLSAVFTSSSTEAIWHLVPITATTNTSEGNTFNPTGSGRPGFGITADLLNSFDANDKRKTEWIKTAQNIPHPYKYRARNATPTSEFYIIFRLAEQYLIRSEARAEQGKLASAIEDLNKTRVRAGLGSINPPDIAAVKLAIEKERRAELFVEWGHRWLDLKRIGKINSVLSTTKPGQWQNTDALFPIPLPEILKNPYLIQNAGYY